MKTPLEMMKKHIRDWTGCTRCTLGLMRQESNDHMVFGRGSLPCEVLFLGEAPGESESCNRVPFEGPAGKLLEEVIEHVQNTISFSYAMTNLVCCIPRDLDGHKVHAPAIEHVEACMPRLSEFVKICNPDVLVMVGREAEKYVVGGSAFHDKLELTQSVVVTYITHPAAVLRLPNSPLSEAYVVNSAVDIAKAITTSRQYRRK